MIRIVTGNINSGKTTKMYELFKEFGGDGFISIKRMNIHQVHSYELLRLSKGQSVVLALKENNNDLNDKIACQIGPYQFFESSVQLVHETMKQLIEKRISPLYLDEIGPLELMEKCFYETLKMMVSSNLDLIISVRTNSINDVIKKFNLEDFELIEA